MEEDDGVGGRLAGSSIGGGVVTPFMAGVGAGAGAGYAQQHYGDPHAQQQYYAGGSGGGYETASDGTGALSPSMSSYYGASSAGAHPAGMGMGPPMSAATTSSGGYPNPMSAKEREARGGGLGVTNPSSGSIPRMPNPHSPGEDIGSGSGSGSGVVVHQDGGRVPDEGAEGMREIPPTYDSIRS
ncbi:hypothetical protein B0H11DRAFT_1995405, partial [Mycena galericulata]